MAGKQHQQHRVELHQDQFCCSVCLDLLKEPVSIPCGHSYCRHCIEDCWDQEEKKGRYSCPQCRETFSPRPVLKRNTMLAEVVEKLKKSSTQQPSPSLAFAGPEDVACDFCSGTRRNKATMSCLTCLASYCPAHLEPHHSVPVLKKHQLVSATIPLQEKMCEKHNKLMEVYCRTDRKFICHLCVIDEHKGHKTISVSLKKAETEKLLVSSQKEVQERVKKREAELRELNQAEENVKNGAQTAMKDCDKIFAKIISCMQGRCREVKRLIGDQEKVAVAQTETLRIQLEEEISKLKKRDAELKQLLHVGDHIHMIQSFQSLSTSYDSPNFSFDPGSLRSFGDATECVCELKCKLETVVNDTWPRISATVSYVDFSLLQASKTREDFLRYCCPLTLDGNTNYPYLHLIDDDIRVRPSPSAYSAHPERFTKWPQVLCREGLSERCYWEVEWHARTLSAAVAYKDINRTSDESQFGKDDKSWSLECTEKGYLFRHNNVETKVYGPCSKNIGVYLDYRAGTLCFYHVSYPMVLLHKIQTTFTKPLYPGLGLEYEWYDIGVFAQLTKLW
ncbi:E3 ubiquitin-protein ligase TRIM47-like [Anoplopoma fimbria]|uniref:E3 ubiquitin-protein ligase TRIM47-like n=1 Tax=Anoplopoma fimbria TaxID=229290 RepID=UPI0023EB0C2E|nr:E3 ubiquitin-protein ligase TRIM47-like [Anoplopoma fimbria]